MGLLEAVLGASLYDWENKRSEQLGEETTELERGNPCRFWNASHFILYLGEVSGCADFRLSPALSAAVASSARQLNNGVAV